MNTPSCAASLFLSFEAYDILIDKKEALYVAANNQHSLDDIIGVLTGFVVPPHLRTSFMPPVLGINVHSILYFRLSSPRIYENIHDMSRNEAIEDCPLGSRSLELLRTPYNPLIVYDAIPVSLWRD